MLRWFSVLDDTYSCLRLSSRCNSDSDLWADDKSACRVTLDDDTASQELRC